MAVDPRTLDRVVRRVMFARAARCSSRITRTHVNGERDRAPCGRIATYGSVSSGRVSKRCQEHAYDDAARWGVTVDENPAIEVRGPRHMIPTCASPDPRSEG